MIDFFVEGDMMVNATAMLSVAPWKKMDGYLRGKRFSETKSAIKEFLGRNVNLRITSDDILVVNKGNSSKFSQGTWMHRLLAMDFARWLDPKK